MLIPYSYYPYNWKYANLVTFLADNFNFIIVKREFSTVFPNSLDQQESMDLCIVCVLPNQLKPQANTHTYI